MSVLKEIQDYIATLPEPKRSEINELHDVIMQQNPGCTLWFLDGKDSSGKVIANPNIGYGTQMLPYAGGKSREFYQIGISPNQTGISIYIMGLNDKNYLKENYVATIGKASVTGYCIKFKSLKDLNKDVLIQVIKKGFEAN
jgi:hypothetical protein